MKKIALFGSALFLLAAGTALGQDVRYNFDKAGKFFRVQNLQMGPDKRCCAA